MNCVGARFQAAASFLHFHPHVSPTARAYARTRAGSVCSSISVHLHIGDAQTEIFSLHLIVGLPDYAEVAENLNIICYTGKQTSSNPAKSTPAPRHTQPPTCCCSLTDLVVQTQRQPRSVEPGAHRLCSVNHSGTCTCSINRWQTFYIDEATQQTARTGSQ